MAKEGLSFRKIVELLSALEEEDHSNGHLEVPGWTGEAAEKGITTLVEQGYVHKGEAGEGRPHYKLTPKGRNVLQYIKRFEPLVNPLDPGPGLGHQ
ncbi:MAG TPA: hypothetical protein ENF19_02495 [Candidatus Bathyarchaeota archaeon]|nr:hypothetical protein [Candidatus Bathyarchaeota archaeon]